MKKGKEKDCGSHSKYDGQRDCKERKYLTHHFILTTQLKGLELEPALFKGKQSTLSKQDCFLSAPMARMQGLNRTNGLFPLLITKTSSLWLFTQTLRTRHCLKQGCCLPCADGLWMSDPAPPGSGPACRRCLQVE